MGMISAVVLTKNEEKNIEACLKTLQWCDEIIVIDDYSQDRTVELAKNLGAKVYKNHLDNDFAAQRNFGLQKATGDWVLFIDADERVSLALRAEITNYQLPIAKQQAPLITNYQGFNLRRQDYFGGRWLKYGETANIRLLRLGKRKAGKWQRKVHEFWDIKGDIGELKNPLLHYPHPNLDDFLNHLNFYSTLHAEAYYEQVVKPPPWRIIVNPLGKFVANWIFRLGFLDGTSGFIIALMMSFHSFLAWSKLSLKWKK